MWPQEKNRPLGKEKRVHSKSLTKLQLAQRRSVAKKAHVVAVLHRKFNAKANKQKMARSQPNNMKVYSATSAADYFKPKKRPRYSANTLPIKRSIVGGLAVKDPTPQSSDQDYFARLSQVRRILIQSKKPDLVLVSPGPGDYETNFNQICKRGPRVVIGRAPRVKENISQSPGPGEYNIVRSETYSRSERSVSFGKQPRMKSTKNDVPAPNEYELPKNSSIKNVKFGHAIRNTMDVCFSKTEGTMLTQPVPGSYYTPEKVTGPVYSFSRTEKEIPIRLSPGPAAYNPYELLQKPKKGLPFCERTMTKTKQSDTPGPGAYEIPSPRSFVGGVIPTAKSTFPRGESLGPAQFKSTSRDVGKYLLVS